MLTYIGKRVDVEHIHLADIDIRDIAHHLALINRFNGATRVPYSVAQHSIHVAQYVPAEFRLWGLLHDAAEAYVGDIIAPMKAKEAMEGHQELERCVRIKILRRFGLLEAGQMYLGMPPEVREADKRMVLTEGKSLMKSIDGWNIPNKPYDFTIQPWCWQKAETDIQRCLLLFRRAPLSIHHRQIVGRLRCQRRRIVGIV